MRKNEKIYDERIVSESNRIFKNCFYIVCIFLFADIIVKFNLWGFEDKPLEFWVTMGFESLFLVTMFFLSTFMLAKKGITIGAADLDGDSFPKKRYLVISLLGGAIVSAGLWTIRFAAGNWEYGLLNAIIFCGMVYLVTFAIAFAVLFSTFYLGYRVAKKSNEKITGENI